MSTTEQSKFLITGASGQLGREFQDILADSGRSFVAPDEEVFDITSPEKMEAVIKAEKPTIIVNCAAYNAVDKAEKDPDAAMSVNAKAVEDMAILAKKYGIFLIHYSSDYIFDGKKKGIYTEDDKPKPINEYGKSKLKGEEAIQEHLKDYLIFRLSWVIGNGTQNFLYKLHTWTSEKDVIQVSADEVSVPTYTEDIVDVTLMALDKGLKGVYNLTNSGYCSRYELAKYFVKKMGLATLVIPVALATFKTAAKRPLFSVMTNEKITKALDITIPKWEYGVDRFVEMFAGEDDAETK